MKRSLIFSWVFATLFVAVTLFQIATFRWLVMRFSYGDRRMFVITFSQGSILIRDSQDGPAFSDTGTLWSGVVRPFMKNDLHWLPSYQSYTLDTSPAANIRLLYLPIWPASLFLLILWFFCMRRAKIKPVGSCKSCGYDLTGNISGKCPECGTPCQQTKAALTE